MGTSSQGRWGGCFAGPGRSGTGRVARALVLATFLLTACAGASHNTAAPGVTPSGATPVTLGDGASPGAQAGGTGASPGSTPAPSATNASGSKSQPKAGSGASSGSTGSQAGGQSAGSGTSGGTTYTIVVPGGNQGSGSQSFSGNIGSISSSPGAAQPSPSSTAPCSDGSDPATASLGITGVHLDSVDSSGTAHGPQTTFSSSSDKTILAVLNVSGLVTGTVVSYVQTACSTSVDYGDFTLTTEPANLYFKFVANPSFIVGDHRLLFYVNAKTNTTPAALIDYTVTP